MKDQQNGKAARAEMEAAKTESERNFSGQRLPRRYRLYDKIKDHVSLKTIDAVIAITAALIIGFLIYGILTASP
jgi:hypothetical protein